MTKTENVAAKEPDEEVNLLELASVIWGGRYWVLAATLLAGLLGIVAILKTNPEYRANGLLQLQVSSDTLALPQSMQSLLGASASGNTAIDTEVQILGSRMVIGDAVRKLDLQIFAQPRPLPFLGPIPARLHLADPHIAALAPYQWGNEAIELGAITVPEAWLGRAETLTITAPGRFRIRLPDGTSAAGVVGRRLDLPAKNFSLTVARLEGPVGRQFLVGRQTLDAAIGRVQARFGVAQAGNQAAILKISYTASSPGKAERVLNAIAQSYVDQNIQRSAAAARNSLDFIRKQLPVAEAAVGKAQDALNAYQQKNQSVDLTYQTQALLQKVTDLESKLNALDLKEQQIKNLYTPNHPVFKELLQDRAALKKQLEDAKAAVDKLPEKQKEIFNLQRDLDVAQQIYVQLLNAEQELRVVRASTVGSVRVIDKAYAPAGPVAPRKSRMLAIALLIGMAAGVAGVLTRFVLRRGIRGAQQIEQIGLPVFATIPFVAEAANLRQRRGHLPILALSNPDNLATEAIRSLRTSLHFGMLDATTSTILFTSAAPMAGKSFLASNLAVVAAQAGQKVCLVDADLRRGYIRRFLGRERTTPGLAEYLAKEKTLDEVLLDGPVEGLSVMVSGRFPPNPSEILMRAEFQTLLETLDTRFDLIIIDSPPALAVTDPVIVGHYVGASILVARHTETLITEVEAVRRAFDTAGIKLTGAVLNGYKLSEDTKYSGRYSYYNYRYSYKSDH